MEQFKFLDNKDKSFPSTNTGKRTIEWAKENNFKIRNREDIWRAYVARLESIFTGTNESNKDNANEVDVENSKASKSSRALRLLKYKILKNNTLDLENEGEIKKIATGLYESEKKIAIERGMGADIDSLDESEVIERYIENIKEKKEVQSETLKSWIDYITGPDCTLPTWFKYHAIRSLLAMGTKSIEKADYNKRASTTVSPYPEFNSEALGWVYKAINKELVAQDVVSQVINSKIQEGQELTEDDRLKESSRIEGLMSSDKFSKLFYFANLEVKGNLDRSFVEGEWVKYDQGSDHTLLEKSLKGKGTGWCTAEGSAAGQIENGDFYVYYSKNGNTGSYSEPRIAIRMNGKNEILEVRGVNPGQELEPQFTDIVDAKMNDFGEDEAKKYKKKTGDMRILTQINKKAEMLEELTKEELKFLYEIDSSIEGFGYKVDPRIEEIKEKRKDQKLQDYIKMFDVVGDKEIGDLKRKLNIDGLGLNNPHQVLEVKMINPKQVLTTKEPTDTKAGLFLWGPFQDRIGNALKEASYPESLSFSSYTLDQDMTLQEILNKTNSEPWTIDQIAQLIDNQSQILGNMTTVMAPLKANRSNIFLVKDKNGVTVAVDAHWYSDRRKWGVDVRDHSDEWDAGDQVLLRND